jgi:hypothetical protein
MELKLDERYRIISTSMNWVLENLADVKDKVSGEVTRQEWRVVGYFGFHLNHAIKRYVSEVVRNDDSECDVDCLLVKLNEIDEKIDRIVRKENITFELKKEEVDE